MKIKQRPEDFHVEELTDVAPTAEGPFAFYRLEKRGWSTPDAIQVIRRRWKLDVRRVSYGGLKDRHAQTVQYFTVFHGPRRHLTQDGIRVEYLGQLATPYASQDIRANRFRVILRALTADEIAQAEAALEEVRRDGVPNYFDDQRFGSVAPTAEHPEGEFVARLLVQERYEDALRLALAAPYEFDRAAQKREKALLRKHWGDWAACKERLSHGPARRLADYLADHPGDFRGAVAGLPSDLRILYLSAYQSHLWNRMLALWVRQRCRPEQLVSVRMKLGDVPMHRRLDEAQRAELSALALPLPTARAHLDPSDPRLALMQTVLAEEGLELRQFQFKGIRQMFFSKGERAALCLPSGLSREVGPDELHAGRQKLILSFDLPRGCYATMIVKRITANVSFLSEPEA